MNATGTNTAIRDGGCRYDGTRHLRHGRLRGLQRRKTVFELTFDILDHDDCVVDHEADREHHAKQTQHIQRKSHDLHHGGG
jgi:hypothetical protein